ncbi:uncharacterized protein BO97DRAFT_437951 [Aspergillus homomorphus CBS 101889]|uniref:Uncharacterized protein n=1 Tax=Aspergillus homomorphus (strain CBS 101889) TaxID=1450537 RepID=A0A395HKC2_ASPHC|nr:hypothetical protein BO97DRAFT_437951 [Aspergillus homomorphus CBS 101889]RAL08056.1 hypothetical protein BO97DRAFT_437951 [Aspergillus homomorphus CBS 101889]
MAMLELLLALMPLSAATITLHDPSDDVDLQTDVADNALTANWNYTPTLYQVDAITGAYEYTNEIATISHATLSETANDTSVVVFTESSSVNISSSKVVKHGYSSDLYQASFFGLNAAGTYVSITHSRLYSSGPVSHSLYAGDYGTIVGRNLRHYSGGYRSSAFAGDSPQGYVYVYDSIAHTAEVGSAIIYGQATVKAENVAGYAERAPIAFLDSATVRIAHSNLTAGLLAGVVTFSSDARTADSEVTVTDSRMTVLPADAPALWFGNVVASAALTRTTSDTASNILIVANYSQVTQDFSYFAASTAPADATVTVAQSDLRGDLVAYDGSAVRWALGNVYAAGFTLYYDGNATANAWFGGKTVSLARGGQVTPASEQQLTGK